MLIKPVKTEKVIPGQANLYRLLDKYLKSFKAHSILVITSKIVAISEGRMVRAKDTDKDKLIQKEADYFLPKESNKYGITLTIKNEMLIPTAGIDKSNGNGYYILWPKNPQQSANDIRKYLCQRFRCRDAGVIISDSKTSPLRRGTTGVSIAHSGFRALKNYIGKKDIFGRKLKFTKADLADALAAAAVATMGEGNEQTPLAVIEDIPFIKFSSRAPDKKELSELHIKLKEDLYGPLLTNVKWRRGGGN